MDLAFQWGIEITISSHFMPRKYDVVFGSVKVSGKLPTYPSPNSMLTFASHLGQNVVLGEG